MRDRVGCVKRAFLFFFVKRVIEFCSSEKASSRHQFLFFFFLFFAGVIFLRLNISVSPEI